MLGEDHQSSLLTATNLATDLRAMGDYRAAYELDEAALHRCRGLFGDDSRVTLAVAGGLSDDLRELGEHARAREVAHDVHAGCSARITPKPSPQPASLNRVGQPSASDSRSTFLRTLPDAVSGKVSTKTHVVGVL